ncbi:MAG: radical SAM protein [Candidatus Omnitrophota bacterium]
MSLELSSGSELKRNLENGQAQIKDDYRQWYEDVYPRLTNYGIWLRGNEMNTLAKEEYHARPFRILFARLSTYDDVAASFTHRLLYQIASGIPYVFADIAYLPPANDAHIFAEYGVPWLLGTNTKFGPERFSLVAFSNSIVQEILNIPWFLKKSGIPLKRDERLKRGDIPLIILGGANAAYTTSVWGQDSLLDGVFIGGSSYWIKRIFEICAQGYQNNLPKIEILRALQDIPGFYVTDTLPVCGQRTGRQKALALPKEAAADVEILGKGIVPYNEAEIGVGHLQISQGCRAFCSFCSESWLRKPYRELTAGFLLEKALTMKAEMGLESIIFFSFNFNMYSQFYQLFRGCSGVFKSVGLKSQRFDMFACDREMIEYQTSSDKAVFSCALEGISPRVRRYLNKNLHDQAFYQSVGLIFKAQARELKIFIISTGKEEETDFQEFETLLGKVAQSKDINNARTRVIFSITPLVMFPWTPLEFDRAALPCVHAEIIERLRRLVTQFRFECRQAMSTEEYLVSQVLVRAAPEIKQALLGALEETGFVYYREVTHSFYTTLLRCLSSYHIAMEELLKGFSEEESAKKTWAVIDTGVKRNLLWEIFQKNIRFTETGTDIAALKIAQPGFTLRQYRAEMNQIKTDERSRDFYVTVNALARGLPRKYFGLVLARALMKTAPELAPYFRSYISSFRVRGVPGADWISGDDIIRLSWDKQALPTLDKILAEPRLLNMVNASLQGWGVLTSASPVAFNDTYCSGIRLHIDSPYDFDGLTYFKKSGLKYTLYKSGEGCYQLRFTRESLKKRVISQCALTKRSGASGVLLDVVPGENFDAAYFLRYAFVLPSKNDWVKIKAVSIIMTDGKELTAKKALRDKKDKV